jgi:hypothetical protein
MKKNIIDYSDLVDDAMHFIVKRSLEIFAGNNLDGDHHLFISFITKYPGVSISEKLHHKYPYEMTIVLQHQFENLLINDDGFSVCLSFDNQQEEIVVPFSALTAFADPSVKFGLQFRHVDEDQASNDQDNNVDLANNSSTYSKKDLFPSTAETKGNVIALDFKNKKLK